MRANVHCDAQQYCGRDVVFLGKPILSKSICRIIHDMFVNRRSISYRLLRELVVMNSCAGSIRADRIAVEELADAFKIDRVNCRLIAMIRQLMRSDVL